MKHLNSQFKKKISIDYILHKIPQCGHIFIYMSKNYKFFKENIGESL